MRAIFGCLLALGLWVGASSVTAVAAPAEQEVLIQRVISDQIEAFQADDGARAFSHAAPTIQNIFRNPDNFMAMVREGYAPLYRPAEIDFRDLSAVGRNFVQRVYIRGANGEAVIAAYTMQLMADGSWKISGCQIEKLPELAA